MKQSQPSPRQPPSFPLQAQWILIDADDTLWENNIYFEEAFHRFVDLLDHSHLSKEQIREVLDEIELENIKIHGYGSANFGRNLQECYKLLAEQPFTERELEAVWKLAEEILRQPIKLIRGVEATLAYLAERYHLTLFSKGHPEEQHLKVDRSGLRQYFDDCRIVKEKDAASYRGFVAEAGVDPGETWMVGNSPKSDINPALEVGLGAILVPHSNTWHLEHENVPQLSQRFRILQHFTDLAKVF